MKRATIKKGCGKIVFLPRYTDLPVSPVYNKSDTPAEHYGRFPSPIEVSFLDGNTYDVVSENETVVMLRHYGPMLDAEFLKSDIQFVD